MINHTIPDVLGYTITEDGKVFSETHNWRGYGRREMKQRPDSDGYPSVRLTVDGIRKRFAVHRLMCLTFIPRPMWATEIRHLDGNPENNHIDNLAWGNQKLNAKDRELHGRTSRGISHSMAIKKGLKKRGYNVT